MSFSDYVNIRNQHIVKFEYHTGGGMTGGYYRETVSRYDDTSALIRTEKAGWHNEKPEIKEYIVDIAIMDELEKIIRKYKMNFWNRKKFTNAFIADGESIGYSFTFDDAEIDFSSQFYPVRYREKLKKFDEILNSYSEHSVENNNSKN